MYGIRFRLNDRRGRASQNRLPGPNFDQSFAHLSQYFNNFSFNTGLELVQYPCFVGVDLTSCKTSGKSLMALNQMNKPASWFTHMMPLHDIAHIIMIIIKFLNQSILVSSVEDFTWKWGHSIRKNIRFQPWIQNFRVRVTLGVKF